MNRQIYEEDMKNILKANLPWNDFNEKTVLITGANGFLPAYIVEALLFLNNGKSNKNHKVIGLVRNLEKAKLRFHQYLHRDDFMLLVQDVCTPIKINENINYIVHAASQASPKYYGVDPVGTLNANILGTNNVLQLAKEKMVKGFLYFSSAEVYGEVDAARTPTKEEDYGYLDPVNVRSCYAESKRMGETMCVSWLHQYGTPVRIVRPFHTYGPGMSLDDGRVYADFVSDIVNNRDITIESDGSAIRSFCYLSDATKAFFTVLLAGKDGEAYNVGNGQEEISIYDLACKLVKLYPKKSIKIKIREKNHSTGYIKSKLNRICPDTTKIQKLGWEANIPIREGFKRTIDSYL